MKLSKNGINLVREFEGYHKKLPNGDCTTYYCPAGVLTIGYGCTEGIRKGEIWTHDQAIAALRKELKRFEDAVNRLVTTEINQNQFDALVSFAYNCGEGALAKSSLLRLVNKGDFEGAARQFGNWTRGGGRVLPGLVRRRAAEAALFRTAPELNNKPDMPQAVDEPQQTTFIMTGYKSGTVWSQITAALAVVAGMLTDWAKNLWDLVMWAIGIAPEVYSDAKEGITSAQEMAGWFGQSIGKITVAIAFICFAIAIIRHVNDKKKLEG